MKKNILILVIPLLLSSCESWLDVKPNDRISEEATFSTPRGFELALNGVYVDLNKTSLYGQALTWDVEFFGFKLHLVINDKGEILNFMFSPANVDDREPLKQGNFQRDIKGKLCADKEYIGQIIMSVNC